MLVAYLAAIAQTVPIARKERSAANAFEDNALHFQCLRAASPEAFSAAQCGPALPAVGATWWIIGNSLMHHLTFVAGRRLVAALGIAQGTDGPAQSPPRFQQQPWAWREIGRAARHGRELSCVRADKRRVCYVPLGAADGNWAVTSIVEALSRLLATNQTTADDVAFIQFGAHLMGSANTEGKHLRYVRQFTRSVSRLPPLRLVWLEQFAQHFATPDGVYAPGSTGGCRPLADTVTKPPILAKVAAEVSQHASILLVDAWTLTRNASGHHLAREHGRVDCTHYCLFSGVYDSVLAAAACALSELRVNVSELSSSQTQRRSVYAQSYENDAGARRAAAAERTVPRARSRQGSDRRPADQHDLHAPANAASRHLCAASFPAAWSALHELRPRTVAYVCDPNVATGWRGL